MRVVSLLPAATEIVAALGAVDRLVGITHECDYPPAVTSRTRVTRSAIDASATAAGIDAEVRSRAVAGDALFTLDAERIAALAPDVILTQAVCEVCAVREGDVRALAARLAPSPRVVTLAGTTIDGVMADITNVGGALGLHDEAEELVLGLRARLRAVHETLKRARAPRPRVIVVEWTDPVFVAGHWTPEMVRRAGGEHLLVRAGEHSRAVTIDELRAAAPEVVILAPCGYSLERARDEAATLLTHHAWTWAATLPVWVIDGNALTSRPGPRVVRGVELMARLFHPALFSPIFHAAALPLTLP